MRWLSALACDISVEAETADLALRGDPRNIHAWLSRRRSLLQDASRNGAELQAATKCIEVRPRSRLKSGADRRIRLNDPRRMCTPTPGGITATS